MGINAHILPGDLLVINISGTLLYHVHPDEIVGDPNLFADDERVVCVLRDERAAILVLRCAKAGSNGEGHAFFVMTSEKGATRMGWIMNHVVRGLVTQRQPAGYL